MSEHGENGSCDGYAASSSIAERGGMSRRDVCLGVGGIAVLFGLGGLKFAPREGIVRPPGGQDENRLLGACVRCERCAEVCPRQVISPAHLEKGVLGVRTPEMNFYANFCDWCEEENGGVPLCAKSCPTGALSLDPPPTPESCVLGVAVIDNEQCLAQRMTLCRTCYDACRYQAIELDEMSRPYVVPERCNGCGACESVCVSLTNASIGANATERAIVVRPIG